MSTPNTSDTIVPFWNRLPAVMAYPAHAGAMATIVLLGLAQVLWILPLGWILVLLAAIALYRYAFECLQASAEGFLTPPQVSLGARSLGGTYIWMIVILFLALIVGTIMLGRSAGVVLALMFGACLPAATMTLAMTDSLGEALNPLKWMAIIAAIGWPYLAMVGVSMAILMSEGFAKGFVAQYMPLPVALIGLGIISNYATIALFHLMGYVLYQYHEQLGLTPEATQRPLRPAQAADPDQAALDEASTLVRDGKLAEAIELLRGPIRRGGTPAVHAQYRKLLRAADDKAGLLAHGRERIGVLVDQDDERAAVDLLRECQALDAGFAPETALQVSRLAHMAARQGQAQAALQLLEGFAERFKGSQYIATNGLLVADLLHEKLGRDTQARDVLLELKTRVPNDPLMPDIDAKLATIERMIAATARKPAPPA
ncbi:MAG: DUF4013 domain-containing protein [Proteobacteria bacterium]|nr:DUF4013 domain-containing protein [Pseudomonadota bacterium]